MRQPRSATPYPPLDELALAVLNYGHPRQPDAWYSSQWRKSMAQHDYSSHWQDKPCATLSEEIKLLKMVAEKLVNPQPRGYFQRRTLDRLGDMANAWHPKLVLRREGSVFRTLAVPPMDLREAIPVAALYLSLAVGSGEMGCLKTCRICRRFFIDRPTRGAPAQYCDSRACRKESQDKSAKGIDEDLRRSRASASQK